MSNQKILNQVGDARAAADYLAGRGVEIRRIYVANDQEQAVLVCVDHPLRFAPDAIGRTPNHGWQECYGCRLVWLQPDMAPEHGPSCRVCGCHENHRCIDIDTRPCFWAQPGLCSRCARKAGVDVDVLRPDHVHTAGIACREVRQ